MKVGYFVLSYVTLSVSHLIYKEGFRGSQEIIRCIWVLLRGSKEISKEVSI